MYRMGSTQGSFLLTHDYKCDFLHVLTLKIGKVGFFPRTSFSGFRLHLLCCWVCFQPSSRHTCFAGRIFFTQILKFSHCRFVSNRCSVISCRQVFFWFLDANFSKEWLRFQWNFWQGIFPRHGDFGSLQFRLRQKTAPNFLNCQFFS